MTIEDTKNLLHKISSVYVSAFANKTIEQKKMILNEWYKEFQADDFESVMTRLENHIKKSKYAPTIAELKNVNSNKFNNYSTTLTDFDRQVLQNNMNKYHRFLEMSDDEFNKFLKEKK